MTTPSAPARVSLALLLASVLVSSPLAATASVPGEARPSRIANGSGPTPMYLPTADAGALASGDADRTVRDAFLGPDAPGAMLVRGVPGYAQARADALRSLALCAASPEGRDAFVRSETWEREHGDDGTFSKMSVAAAADGRLPIELDRACGADLRPKLEALRAAADAAATAVLPRLDELLGYDTGGFFAAAASSAGSLDHFHVYARSADAAEARASLATQSSSVDGDARGRASPSEDERAERDEGEGEGEGEFAKRKSAAGKDEHVDVGVAIVMTPAFLVLEERETDGRFSPELDAFGSRGLTLGGRAPELPPDALIVMLGEAARAWAPPPPKGADANAIAVPSHAMSLELERRMGDSDDALRETPLSSSRAWFGRMVLPPDDTAHPTLGTTFGAWRKGVARAFRGDEESDAASRRSALASASCSPRRRLADDASCGAGEVYCWLACVADTSGGCGADEELKCVEPGTGLVWPDDLGAQSHCYDCEPTCVASNAAADDAAAAGRAGGSTNAFCNDKIAPVSMYMDGFLGWSDPNGPCVAFLHRDLVLTSPGLLFAAFFATVAAGVAVEGLAAARRWRAKTQDAACLDAIATGGNPSLVSMALKTQALLLYGTQCSAGYLLMLVSMTYHAVLFVGVVLGLVIGHAWFNAAAPLGARGGASACCQHVAADVSGDPSSPDGEEDALGDEHQDGGSSGSGGSADDHSSLDSLNRDLLARRGARRGVEMMGDAGKGPDLV